MGSDAFGLVLELRIACFNSRSRMGSDSELLKSRIDGGSFNSRSRMGSDMAIGNFIGNIIVSIRAPAWGATDFPRAQCMASKFQFALPHGERLLTPAGMLAGMVFQFALPHGERHKGWDVIRITGGFNSRSRMGSDCHHAMTGTACIESALFASQAGKVLWGKMQFVCHVFKSISIQHAISAANTPAFR